MSCQKMALWYIGLVMMIGSGCREGALPKATSEQTSDAPSPAVVSMKPHKPDVTPQEAKQLLDSDAGYVYLDVRTVAEFEAGHVPGSLNIPYLTINPAGERIINDEFLPVAEVVIPKDARLIVGCRSGARSKMAQSVLDEAGYATVSNVLGGFVGTGEGPDGKLAQPGWSALGLPVETGAGTANSYANLRGTVKP